MTVPIWLNRKQGADSARSNTNPTPDLCSLTALTQRALHLEIVGQQPRNGGYREKAREHGNKTTKINLWTTSQSA